MSRAIIRFPRNGSIIWPVKGLSGSFACVDSATYGNINGELTNIIKEHWPTDSVKSSTYVCRYKHVHQLVAAVN